MRAEIICIGSELLLGDIADTNTQYLARRLSSVGIDLFYSTAVGDNLARMGDCLRRAFERSELIITSGGLGPTDDDLTREAVAELVGEVPVVNETIAESLRRFFQSRRLTMTTNNLKQAWLIPSAQAIPNSRGTAPGWWVRKDGRQIILLPGPPAELHYMWEREVEPRLSTGGEVIKSRTLKLFNISESRVDEMLKPFTPSANPTVAIYAKQDGIHVRITSKSAGEADALRAIATVEAEVRAILGGVVWGTDEETLDSVAASLLEQHDATIAVAESITCGQLASALSGSERGATRFRGGLVVPTGTHGAAGALSLARTALQRFGGDIAIGVSGGPVADAETPMDDVEIAVVWPCRSVEHVVTQRTRHYRRGTLGALYALDELRKVLTRE